MVLVEEWMWEVDTILHALSEYLHGPLEVFP